ncbi:MAG: GNAT family N-acetyltransferase [Oscillospiraceae bacterium]|nr:GNAT family N-acetyltransferase [Oscillospiraceae bacterium]
MRLEQVNGKNIWELVKLRVKEGQASFVATNTESILEAYVSITSGGTALPFGIYDGDVPVGFLMIGYDTDRSWKNPPPIATGNYNLWRLMIDQRFQGRGYGRQAVKLALEYIRTFPCGAGALCWLSYEPENQAAKKLYESCGFRATGELDMGELIMAQALQGGDGGALYPNL